MEGKPVVRPVCECGSELDLPSGTCSNPKCYVQFVPVPPESKPKARRPAFATDEEFQRWKNGRPNEVRF